jgi:acetoin utilization deacetylase AcuC-like enzyme
MGFCLFNNVAVGAAHALARGLERVLIVDFDVHHGNGTQAIFARDPRVLYVSSHAFPFYPGTGGSDEVGEGPGRGFTVNLPLPDGMDDAVYARLYREVVEPVGKAFAPQLVLASAGFDAHHLDPLAGMALSARGFGELAQVCLDVAAGSAGGRCVVALEGGYDLSAIAASSAAVVGSLLGARPDAIPETSSVLGGRLARRFRAELAPFWPVLAD